MFCIVEPDRFHDGSQALIKVSKNVGGININEVHSVGSSIGDSVDGQLAREELSLKTVFEKSTSGADAWGKREDAWTRYNTTPPLSPLPSPIQDVGWSQSRATGLDGSWPAAPLGQPQSSWQECKHYTSRSVSVHVKSIPPNTENSMLYGYDENDNNNMSNETKRETNYSIITNNNWNDA